MKPYNFSLKLNFSKVLILITLLLLLLFAIPYTYSRFESNVTAEIKSEVAYYLLETNYVTNSIKIDDLIPSDTPYIYSFSIANNDGTKRLETILEYVLTISTTTNLPLEYELYMNEDYTNPGATNMIVADNFITDADGTYFRELQTNKEFFNYIYDEVNNYTLVVYFPKLYSSHEYQGIIENLEIKIDSKQIIDSALPVNENLVLHMDATSFANLNNNEKISLWSDQSISGYDATQSTTNYQPIYIKDVDNGKPGIRFNNTNEEYLATSLSTEVENFYATSGNQWTVSVVFKYDGADGVIAGAAGGIGTSTTFAIYTDGGDINVRFRGTTDPQTVSSNIETGVWHQITVVWDGTTATGYFNDEAGVTLPIGSASNQGENFYIGSCRVALDNYNHFTGDIGEVVVYDNNLNITDRESVRDYLGEKWLGW